jgi:hypothetical protein
MTGAIPPYGRYFRLDSHLPYDMTRRFASRHYVLKADAKWDIISNPKSKRWYVRFNESVVSLPFDRLQDAMTALRVAYDALHVNSPAPRASSECEHPGVFAGDNPTAYCQACDNYIPIRFL